MATGIRQTSLSRRLIGIYALLVAAALVIAAAIVLQLTRAHLYGRLDEALSRTLVSFESGPGRLVERPRDLEAAARSWLATQRFAEGQVAAIRLPGGQTLATSGADELRSAPEIGELLSNPRPMRREISSDGEHLRVVTAPLQLRGKHVGALLVAVSESQANATIGALLASIAWACGAVLVLAAVLGFIAVSRSLSPLRSMTEKIKGIRETGNLGERVAGSTEADEVAQLGLEFNLLLERLEQAFTSQRRRVAEASHELRTPLAIARGQLELIRDQLAPGSDSDVKRSVGIGIEELDRMARIVDDLLLLARLDEGLQLQMRPVEVELILREALLRAMLVAERRFEVDVSEGLFVVADPERLMQVITNLLTNALTHAGDGAELRLRARSLGDRAEIQVSDTGKGIAAQDIPHVFDRLYRGSEPRTDVVSGAGLGLAIARSLIVAMDGDIRVASTPGVGTTFTIELPRALELGESTGQPVGSADVSEPS